jgi:quinol monooxygenase YgiN
MERKVDTQGTVLAIATYKPKPEQHDALMKLVEKHLPALRELGFATAKENYLAKAKDGTIIEIFEWTSMNAISAAHQHPAISDIWEKMTLIADFAPLSSLAETQRPFPGFEMLN